MEMRSHLMRFADQTAGYTYQIDAVAASDGTLQTPENIRLMETH